MSRSTGKLLAAVVGGLGLCSVGACLALAIAGTLMGSPAPATPTVRPTTLASRPTPATPTPAPLVVAGCGGSVVVGFDARLRADLKQWNRIAEAANANTQAWNTFLEATRGATYAQAAGDGRLVAAADAYLAVAQGKLPLLRAETSDGRFATLAAQDVAATEAQLEYATLFRRAVAESDREAWNRAVDAAAAVDETRRARNEEIERQCEFWRSRR